MAVKKAKSPKKNGDNNKKSDNKFVAICKKTLKTLRNTPIFSIMVAEFVGTLLLTVVFIQMQSYPIYLGYAVVGIALLVGGISGAHLNPAMTFGAWVIRKVNTVTALGYIAAQILGATLGWIITKGLLGAAESATTTATAMYTSAAIPTGKEWFLFFTELFGAAILGLGVAAAIKMRKNRMASAMAYGMAVLAAFYIVMVLTSSLLTSNGTTLTFLNPVIAGVLNVFSGASLVTSVCIYVLAPIFGGVLGFAIYELMQITSTDTTSSDCNC